MNKEEFENILYAELISEDDFHRLEELIHEYPWFSIPRFLRLKAARHSELPSNPEETSKAVVFSSNREHLYKWIQGEASATPGLSSFKGSELEFLIENGEGSGDSNLLGGSFELIDEEESTASDVDTKAIPEKEESEMEEPELADNIILPILESFDEEEGIEEELDLTENKGEDEKIIGEYEALPRRSEVDFLLRNTMDKDQEGLSNKSNGLIEEFLKRDPGVIKADKETKLEGDVSVHSVQEDDSFITDTLAKIYVKQGLHAKAIYAYERLSLKYPEKSAYFAAQIEKIKNITNT